MNRALPLVLSALALAGCSGSDAARDGDTAASAAGSAGGAVAGADDQLGDLDRYRLTMDNVRKYGEAMRNISAAARTIPESQRPNIDASNTSVDGYARQLESHPQIRDAIRRADMSTRDFAYTMMAMLQAGMAEAVIQMRPELNADSLAREMKVNPENIRFVRENKAELEAMQQRMAREMEQSEP